MDEGSISSYQGAYISLSDISSGVVYMSEADAPEPAILKSEAYALAKTAGYAVIDDGLYEESSPIRSTGSPHHILIHQNVIVETLEAGLRPIVGTILWIRNWEAMVFWSFRVRLRRMQNSRVSCLMR